MNVRGFSHFVRPKVRPNYNISAKPLHNKEVPAVYRHLPRKLKVLFFAIMLTLCSRLLAFITHPRSLKIIYGSL